MAVGPPPIVMLFYAGKAMDNTFTETAAAGDCVQTVDVTEVNTDLAN